MEKKPSLPELERAASRDPQRFGAQLPPILLLTLIFFLGFVARIGFAPLAPVIETYFQLTHAQAGSLFLMMSAGYFTSLLGSGWLAAGLHHRTVIFISTVVLGAALVSVAFVGSPASLRLVLFLVGGAAGLYLPSGIASITQLAAPNLGFVTAPLLAELVMIWFSWKAVPVLTGLGVWSAGIYFFKSGRGGDFSGTAPGFGSFATFLTEPSFWIMVVLFGLGISGTLGLYTMLPLYLVNEHAIDRELANTYVGLSRAACLVMALASGWLTDRFGPRRVMMAVFLLAGIATIIMGAASHKWVLAAVFIQPLPAVCFFPAGFAMLSRIGPAGSRNIAVSLTIPIAFLIGGGAVPTLIGYLGDQVSFAFGIVLVGAIIAAGCLPAAMLKRS